MPHPHDGYLRTRRVYTAAPRAGASMRRCEILVDAFKDNGTFVDPATTFATFFLSHFHSDHYGGMLASFAAGPLYCTPITRGLVATRIGVPLGRVGEVVVGGTYDLDTITGALARSPPSGDETQPPRPPPNIVRVHVLDAHHCPGAAMFVFESAAETVLHTGDFRLHEATIGSIGPGGATEAWKPAHDALQRWAGRIDRLFLDNTFCHPRYEFPDQQAAVDLAAARVRSRVNGVAPRPRSVAILCGTYTIGKEKFVAGLRDALVPGAKLYVAPRKAAILQTCGMYDELGCDLWPVKPLAAAIVGEANAAASPTTPMSGLAGVEAAVFLVPMSPFATVSDGVESEGARPDVSDFERVVEVRPTGWAAGTSQKTGGGDAAKADSPIAIPYSEHCSFPELVRFVEILQPKVIVPTVGAASFTKFEPRFAEVCPRLQRRGRLQPITRFLSGLGARSSASSAAVVDLCSSSDDDSVEFVG